jgi:hypothetical protein
MKILVKGGLYLEAADIYILTIKFVEGDKILPGQKLINSDLSFTVKSLTLGTYNYETDSFDVVIEKSNAEIKDLINKEFDLAN